MLRDSDGRSGLTPDVDEGLSTSPICDDPFTEEIAGVRLHVKNNVIPIPLLLININL